MTDKSRESFEAWYQADIPNWALRFNRENNSKGTYSFTGTEKAWQAWKASRAALNAEVKEWVANGKPGLEKNAGSPTNDAL